MAGGTAIPNALGLVGAFKSGTRSPTHALAYYLDRIDRLNPGINAVLELDCVRAVREAAASDRRWAAGRPLSSLDGVPIGVKANIAVQGLAWHGGIAAYADRVATADADCVAALRKAGVIILGSLNMHEAALGATNDNSAFGRCHNPYRHGFTPGGSSGGSAAAVAAGFCAAALGTDTMGSVRIPASFCGIFGHKPLHGLISTTGVVPLSQTLDDVGMLARTADDAAAMMSIIAPEYAASDGRVDPRQIRLGILDVTHPAAYFIANAAAVGIRVDPVALGEWDVVEIRRAALLVVEVEALAVHRAMLSRRPAGFSPQLTEMLRWADRQPPIKISAAYDTLKTAKEMLRRAFAGFDAIVTPTTVKPAFGFAHSPPAGLADFTLLANISGLAATAFPAGLSRDGLPVSAQIIGADDRLSIQLAGLLAVPMPGPLDFL